jgi:hypothetical protein
MGAMIGGLVCVLVCPPDQCPLQMRRYNPRSEQCQKVHNACIERCSETALPTYDDGFKFWNGVNQCLRDAAC